MSLRLAQKAEGRADAYESLRVLVNEKWDETQGRVPPARSVALSHDGSTVGFQREGKICGP